MTNPGKDEALLMALIEGALPPDEAVALEARIASEPELRRDYEACVAICGGLETLGDALEVDVPEINITGAVLEGARAIQSGARPAPEDGLPEDVELIAFLEGVDDSDFSKRLRDDAELQRELTGIQAVWQDLEVLGSAYRLDAPGINIEDEVFDRLGENETGRVVDDLNTLGDIASPEVPVIDIVDDVMTAVAEAKDRPENVVPFRTRPKPNQPRLETSGNPLPWGKVVAAAAAAVLIFTLGFTSRDLLSEDSLMPAEGPANQDPVERHINDMRNDSIVPAESPIDILEEVLIPKTDIPEDAPSKIGPKEEGADNSERIVFAKRPGTLDIFDARRAAMMEDERAAEAVAMLADWAALSPEEALQLLQNMGYTPEAILGAVPFLSNEEAVGLLQGAIGKDPSNPLFRAALAENLMEMEDYDASREQLAAWSQADKTNGMPAYYEAQLLFAQGDVAGGLAALDNAAAYDGVNTYSQDRARNHEAALRGTGMDSESASMLAGIAANSGDYAQLKQLGADLISQGDALAEMGDLEGAAQSYSAALELGQQAQIGTPFYNEAEAALMLQQDAINRLSNISAMTDYLSATNREIVEGFEQLSNFGFSLYDLIANGDISGVTAYFADVIAGGQPIFPGL